MYEIKIYREGGWSSDFEGNGSAVRFDNFIEAVEHATELAFIFKATMGVFIVGDPTCLFEYEDSETQSSDDE